MFKDLRRAVETRFAELVSMGPLFTTSFEKDELFTHYLKAIPEDARQEFTCNACRAFLNHYGNVVAIKGGSYATLWDFTDTSEVTSEVPQRLREYINKKAIDGPFVTKIDKLGTNFNHALKGGVSVKWEHFYVKLPREAVYRGAETIDTLRGNARTTKEVFQRALETISLDSVETVLDLIANNALYRGAEFRKAIENFRRQKQEFLKFKTVMEKECFLWSNASEGGRIRNTAIGTLLVALSEGTDVETAVGAFERMMAPANYRRPTALVTPGMLKEAQKKVSELGLLSSLDRRHLSLTEVDVNNLIFVNRSSTMGGDVFAELGGEIAVDPRKYAKLPPVTLEEFLGDLNFKTNVEFLLEKSHNFVSLLGPVDPESPNLFRWGNPFSWTYANNMTDAIKEKVKTAGGRVDGELRISLEWFNYDDLDLHVHEPKGAHIYYGCRTSSQGGTLDVDMNAGGRRDSRTPVENVIYPTVSREGTYTVKVDQFSRQETIDVGFNVQIECRGVTYDISYPGAMNSRHLEVASFTYSKSEGILNFKSPFTSASNARPSDTVGGIKTNVWHKVLGIMFSPNHWGTSESGNKHLIFALKDARISTPLRGFFNEYLRGDLAPHGKVFELLGAKKLVAPEGDQVTGVGFSLTQRHSFLVRVDGVVKRVEV